jgi:hypothetical protein
MTANPVPKREPYLAIRAASEAAALAFALATLATFMFYTAAFRVDAGSAVMPAVLLGVGALAAVFLTVLVLVRRRFPGKSPVLGARRGAAIGILAVVVVAAAHAGFTFGSAGLLHSLLGQVGYACLVGGGPAALAGALFGHSIECRIFSACRTSLRP